MCNFQEGNKFGVRLAQGKRKRLSGATVYPEILERHGCRISVQTRTHPALAGEGLRGDREKNQCAFGPDGVGIIKPNPALSTPRRIVATPLAASSPSKT